MELIISITDRLSQLGQNFVKWVFGRYFADVFRNILLKDLVGVGKMLEQVQIKPGSVFILAFSDPENESEGVVGFPALEQFLKIIFQIKERGKQNLVIWIVERAFQQLWFALEFIRWQEFYLLSTLAFDKEVYSDISNSSRPCLEENIKPTLRSAASQFLVNNIPSKKRKQMLEQL